MRVVGREGRGSAGTERVAAVRRAAAEREGRAGRRGGGERAGRARKDHGRGFALRLGGRGRSVRSGRGHGARRGRYGRWGAALARPAAGGPSAPRPLRAARTAEQGYRRAEGSLAPEEERRQGAAAGSTFWRSNNLVETGFAL